MGLKKATQGEKDKKWKNAARVNWVFIEFFSVCWSCIEIILNEVSFVELSVFNLEFKVKWKETCKET